MDPIQQAVERIYIATEGKVDKDTIIKKLREYIAMGVPLREAERSVVTIYGGSSYALMTVPKKVEELTPGEPRINLRVKVISINSKTYELEGEKRTMHYGIIGDETGTVPFTAWRLDVALRKGDCVDIINAYTREWQGRVQVIIGNNTKVKLLKDVDIQVKTAIKPAKIIELHPKIGLVEVKGKIIDSREKEVFVDGIPRKVWEGIIGDETGEVPFSAWDVEVNKGDVIKIVGAYVRTFRGMPQLVFDNRCTIEKLNEDIEVHEIPVTLESLEGKGGFNAVVEGIIIDIKNGSGLIYRCPECGRVLSSRTCPMHGKVEPKADLRIKAVLDDGTGATLLIFNREQTERILGMNLKDVIKMVQDNMGNSAVVMDAIEDKLIAVPMRVRGNAISDERYGLKTLVRDFEFLNLEDIAKKAQHLLEELGW